MKKTYTILMVLLLTFVLTSCNNEANPSLVISKYYDSTSVFDNAIELYNDSESSINLKNYTLEIYSNGSVTSSYSIDLTGEIDSKSFYVISNVDATNTEAVSNSDLQSKDLLFNGNDVVALTYKGIISDVVGNIGNNSDFGKDITLVRKSSEFIASNEYNEYSYMVYEPNIFEYFKTLEYPVNTAEALLGGPTLEDQYRELPFVDPDNDQLGGGGAIEVTLSSVADGDTATFKSLDGLTTYRVRFFFIDTREVAGTGSTYGQPWGYSASKFTKDVLYTAQENGSKIEIQSIKGNSLKDGYDRYLGLVWVDSKLVNYMVVRAGYSDVNLGSPSAEITAMAYQQIPYYGYLLNAWERAEINGWGLHALSDPWWNYTDGLPHYPISEIPVPDARLYDSAIDGE